MLLLMTIVNVVTLASAKHAKMATANVKANASAEINATVQVVKKSKLLLGAAFGRPVYQITKSFAAFETSYSPV